MKIIKDNDKKVTIVLEDDDILEISSLQCNSEKVIVKCLDSSLHIDELAVAKIKEKSLEEKEIKKMLDFLRKDK